MTLRPYSHKDFESLYALDILCFAPTFRFSRALLRKLLSSRASLTCVAYQELPEDGQKILGFGIMEVQRRDGHLQGYLSTLDVHPEATRQGIGSALLRALEMDAAKAGATEIYLHVSTANRTAVRLYEAACYQMQSEEPDFYAAGLHALLYRKRLPLPEL